MSDASGYVFRFRWVDLAFGPDQREALYLADSVESALRAWRYQNKAPLEPASVEWIGYAEAAQPIIWRHERKEKP